MDSKTDTKADQKKGVTAYAHIAATLREQIIDGTLPPGSWLRHHRLADEFNTSIQPVRQALQQLEGEGIIENIPNRGGRVRGIDRRRIVHIFEIREAFQTFLCRRFAEESPMSEIRRLMAIQERHDAAVKSRNIREIASSNAEFHAVIHDLGDNEEARRIVERYVAFAQQLRNRYPANAEESEAARQDHHELIECFKRRDAATAGEISSRHVRRALESLMRAFEDS